MRRAPSIRTRMVSPSATSVVRAFHHVHAGRFVPGTQGARHAARAGAAVHAASRLASATVTTSRSELITRSVTTRRRVPATIAGGRPGARRLQRYPAPPAGTGPEVDV